MLYIEYKEENGAETTKSKTAFFDRSQPTKSQHIIHQYQYYHQRKFKSNEHLKRSEQVEQAEQAASVRNLDTNKSMCARIAKSDYQYFYSSSLVLLVLLRFKSLNHL